MKDERCEQEIRPAAGLRDLVRRHRTQPRLKREMRNDSDHG